MLNNRLLSRTAHSSSRGGFTLVELLVVIGIIAILAGVALGPITNGIKKAKESAGLQSAHSIGLAMYSCANDNNQLYPDTSGGTADDIAATLLAGGYVSDASIFSLSGDTAKTALSVSNNTATTISGSGVTCWDFLGNAGKGVSSTSFTYLPILWSTINGATVTPTFTAAAGSAITAMPVAANPFGTDGMAIFYINNSSAFVTTSVTGGVLSVNMVTQANNLNPTSNGVPSGYATITGK